MFTRAILGVRHSNDTSIYELYLATGLLAYGSIMFLINNFLFICLILYKSKRKESDVNDQHFHKPIFNQLFYNSALWLVVTDFCFLISCLGNLSDDGSIRASITLFFVVIEALLVTWGSILFAIIGMFSFLAAIQRITIFYLPKYKFLVTGKWLKYEIRLVYLSVIHYSYAAIVCPFKKLNGQCSYQALYIYSIIIFAISVISAAVYIHIYRLFRKLENMDRGTYLLYQFTPIHSLLMFHSVAHFVGLLIEDRFEMNVELILKAPSYFFFVLNIPGVVSLSYIVSQRNFRNMFWIIAIPIWREISS
ncbi:hypothetical protein CRE_15909 [Caenorhabditis remanei]|uniref:Uncharacterized protein n=1 Tax=Caenorhabditis remanei TaxID=31234 RepID=E3MBH0_CAERE|nr:hypothetical protein CRE_15909 [Caenorhabditis remanei]